MRRLAAVLAVFLCGTGAARAAVVKALQKPPSSAALPSLLPLFGGGQLPGHVVGVLQHDPAAPQRLVLWARGRVWQNLFIENPHDKTPSNFPIDGHGTAMSLPDGVRLLTAADVRQKLPAVVDVDINRGQGVSGANGFLMAWHGVGPQVWKLPLASVVGECVADWHSLAVQHGLDVPQAVDLVYVAWEDAPNRVGVVISRKSPNRIINTHERVSPMVPQAGRPFAAVQYWIDRGGQLTLKRLAAPPHPMK